LDDTFAMDGGKAATRWKAQRATPSRNGKRPYYGGGRKKALIKLRPLSVHFHPDTFKKIEQLAAKNGRSLSKQIAELCEQNLD
jgi:hypothetical protein